MVKIQKFGQSGVGRVEVPLWKETKSPKSQILVWSKMKSWESQSWTFYREKVLKVKVDEMKFNKSKVRLKLAKSTQLCVTLKVGLDFSVSGIAAYNN